MDVKEGKGKKGNLIIQTWERCKSLSRGSKRTSRLTQKSKSWPRIETSFEDDRESKRKRQVAPEGCFSVYVGPQKQRFVIKTEYANHPLFKVLLEEAESEYGYSPEGPLALPCNVDIFCKVLVAMDDDGYQTHQGCGFPMNRGHQGCGFPVNRGSYQHLSPPLLIAMNQF